MRRETFLRDYGATQRCQDTKRLFRNTFKVYSEGPEDGMLYEIFQRVGTESMTFVEIGIGDGLECNTAFLLIQGWAGCWIDCCPVGMAKARAHFGSFPVTCIVAAVTPDNADALVQQGSAGKSLDLLSIDIDSYDYYIWEAIASARPRVVVIEYNASIPPFLATTIKYDAKSSPPVGTIYFGASLGALVKLAAVKGYSLVGCSVTGVNAFFVRDDLVADRFCSPFTAENHYEPPRYGLIGRSGHAAGAGPWTNV